METKEGKTFEDMMANHPRSQPFVVEGVAYVLQVKTSSSGPHRERAKEQARHRMHCQRVRDLARDHYPGPSGKGCNICKSRASEYCKLIGPNGALFLAGDLATDSNMAQLRQAVETVCTLNSKPTFDFKLVKEGTFAPINEGQDAEGQPYPHWTIVPGQVTTPELAARMTLLQSLLPGVDGRLSKLLESKSARKSVDLMEEALQQLQRPGHWRRVISYVQTIQQAYPENWGDMSEVTRWQVRVFALATGTAEGSVHKDLEQAYNLVDFLNFSSLETLRQVMDSRSDPANYQVSQLNRRLAKNQVTSKWTIGLSWKGEFTDDLDLHVTGPSGQECYYSQEQTDDCRLDFDANVSKGEAEPCENISCETPGTYKIEVNNYTRRTFGRDVPFIIVVRELGQPDLVVNRTWACDRAKGNKILVGTHTFSGSSNNATPTLGTKAAKRMQAQDTKWQAAMGQPLSFVATLDDLDEASCLLVRLTLRDSVEPIDDYKAATQASSAVTSQLMAMIQTSQRPTKKLLADHLASDRPRTVADLVKLLTDTKQPHQLSVCQRDHSPGYLVHIQTNEQVRQSAEPAACHYQRKSQLPVKPTSDPSDARLDASWGPVNYQGQMGVAAIAQVNGRYFLALHQAQLPHNDDFPLGGGFYPTDLKTEHHSHRSRWTMFHSQLEPVVRNDGVPAIGTFLTNATATVYLDGVRLVLRV